MVTRPPMQETRAEAPKKVFELADLKEQMRLAKELVRDAAQVVQDHQTLVAKSRETVRRARQTREESKARMRSISRRRFARSAR